MAIRSSSLTSLYGHLVASCGWFIQPRISMFDGLLRFTYIQRLTTKSSDRYYGKLAVLSQALSQTTALKPSSIFSPFESHWYGPPKREKGAKVKLAENPIVACTLLPRPFDEQPIGGGEIDAWDFVLRNVFVLGSSSVKKALAYVLLPSFHHILTVLCINRAVAPGGATLLDKPGTKFIDPKTPVRQVTVDEWTAILKAFNEWPFAPKVRASLVDSSDSLTIIRSDVNIFQTLVLPDSMQPRLGTGFMKDE